MSKDVDATQQSQTASPNVESNGSNTNPSSGASSPTREPESRVVNVQVQPDTITQSDSNDSNNNAVTIADLPSPTPPATPTDNRTIDGQQPKLTIQDAAKSEQDENNNRDKNNGDKQTFHRGRVAPADAPVDNADGNTSDARGNTTSVASGNKVANDPTLPTQNNLVTGLDENTEKQKETGEEQNNNQPSTSKADDVNSTNTNNAANNAVQSDTDTAEPTQQAITPQTGGDSADIGDASTATAPSTTLLQTATSQAVDATKPNSDDNETSKKAATSDDAPAITTTSSAITPVADNKPQNDSNETSKKAGVSRWSKIKNAVLPSQKPKKEVGLDNETSGKTGVSRWQNLKSWLVKKPKEKAGLDKDSQAQSSDNQQQPAASAISSTDTTVDNTADPTKEAANKSDSITKPDDNQKQQTPTPAADTVEPTQPAKLQTGSDSTNIGGTSAATPRPTTPVDNTAQPAQPVTLQTNDNDDVDKDNTPTATPRSATPLRPTTSDDTQRQQNLTLAVEPTSPAILQTDEERRTAEQQRNAQLQEDSNNVAGSTIAASTTGDTAESDQPAKPKTDNDDVDNDRVDDNKTPATTPNASTTGDIAEPAQQPTPIPAAAQSDSERKQKEEEERQAAEKQKKQGSAVQDNNVPKGGVSGDGNHPGSDAGEEKDKKNQAAKEGKAAISIQREHRRSQHEKFVKKFPGAAKLEAALQKALNRGSFDESGETYTITYGTKSHSGDKMTDITPDNVLNIVESGQKVFVNVRTSVSRDTKGKICQFVIPLYNDGGKSNKDKLWLLPADEGAKQVIQRNDATLGLIANSINSQWIENIGSDGKETGEALSYKSAKGKDGHYTQDIKFIDKDGVKSDIESIYDPKLGDDAAQPLLVESLRNAAEGLSVKQDDGSTKTTVTGLKDMIYNGTGRDGEFYSIAKRESEDQDHKTYEQRPDKDKRYSQEEIDKFVTRKELGAIDRLINIVNEYKLNEYKPDDKTPSDDKNQDRYNKLIEAAAKRMSLGDLKVLGKIVEANKDKDPNHTIPGLSENYSQHIEELINAKKEAAIENSKKFRGNFAKSVEEKRNLASENKSNQMTM